MNETLRRSSLSELQAGSRVNLELPVKPDSRLGGHIVQGHVDGVGAGRRDRRRRLRAPRDRRGRPGLLRYVVEKGSITVDGVSLTVASVDGTSFDVSLIPETLERTTLGATEEGTPVNLEVDIVAKYVEKLVAAHGD
jgi:riboflavin synthase